MAMRTPSWWVEERKSFDSRIAMIGIEHHAGDGVSGIGMDCTAAFESRYGAGKYRSTARSGQMIGKAKHGRKQAGPLRTEKPRRDHKTGK